MRILVTGGAGFIGSHVVDAYVRAGHEVWALDDLSRGKREQVNPHAHFVRMDLRSPDLRDLLADGHFDCINHHAAQIDVRVSVADPVRDAMTNIVGTLNLLEAARAHAIPRVIFASTGGAIYGEQCHFPATESHPTIPLSPYGVAKRAVEHYLEYYRQVHGLRYAILRYANVYGPRQDPEGEAGVVAIFCNRILRGQRLFIYGDGEQTRDYVYVEDVARANVLALRYLTEVIESVESVESIESVGPVPCSAGSRQQAAGSEQTLAGRWQVAASSEQIPAGRWQQPSGRPLPTAGCSLPASSSPAAGCQLPAASCRLSIANCQLPASKNGLNNSTTQKLNNGGTVFNIGTGIETSVNALAAMLLESADADCLVVYQPARSGEQARSAIDPTKAAHVLGWRPLTPLSEGLVQTLAWFRNTEASSKQRTAVSLGIPADR